MKYKKYIVSILLIILASFYVIYLYVDFSKTKAIISVNILKYMSIIICFIISLIIRNHSINKEDISLLQAGLLVTTFADLSFLILNYNIFGVIFFCLAQMIYYIRYSTEEYNIKINKFIITFLVTMIFYLLLDSFIIEIDFLYAISFFYLICFIFTFAEMIKGLKNNTYLYPNNYIIFFAMVLFVLCDINVGIYNIIQNKSQPLYNISFNLIWILYIPSQTLLALSGYKFIEE